jgi:hypothetical protein
MQTIFTIGTQGRQDDNFIAMLNQHRIDAVIDIRRRNEGKYCRFASGKHVKALCGANGIAYRHEIRFSPNDSCRRDCYVSGAVSHLTQFSRLARHGGPFWPPMGMPLLHA